MSSNHYRSKPPPSHLSHPQRAPRAQHNAPHSNRPNHNRSKVNPFSSNPFSSNPFSGNPFSSNPFNGKHNGPHSTIRALNPTISLHATRNNTRRPNNDRNKTARINNNAKAYESAVVTARTKRLHKIMENHGGIPPGKEDKYYNAYSNALNGDLGPKGAEIAVLSLHESEMSPQRSKQNKNSSKSVYGVVPEFYKNPGNPFILPPDPASRIRRIATQKEINSYPDSTDVHSDIVKIIGRGYIQNHISSEKTKDKPHIIIVNGRVTYASDEYMNILDSLKKPKQKTRETRTAATTEDRRNFHNITSFHEPIVDDLRRLGHNIQEHISDKPTDNTPYPIILHGKMAYVSNLYLEIYNKHSGAEEAVGKERRRINNSRNTHRRNMLNKIMVKHGIVPESKKHYEELLDRYNEFVNSFDSPEVAEAAFISMFKK